MKRSHIKKLDEQWSQKVKAGNKCQHCGRNGSSWRMEAAHVVGRRFYTTRWGTYVDGKYDLCGHCLCHVCHQQYDEHGPLEHAIVNDTIGANRKACLQVMALKKAPFRTYEEVRDLLRRV